MAIICSVYILTGDVRVCTDEKIEMLAWRDTFILERVKLQKILKNYLANVVVYC